MGMPGHAHAYIEQKKATKFKTINSHFIVIQILMALNMQNLKIGSFTEKTESVPPVTLYNDVSLCQNSEETIDASSSKC